MKSVFFTAVVMTLTFNSQLALSSEIGNRYPFLSPIDNYKYKCKAKQINGKLPTFKYYIATAKGNISFKDMKKMFNWNDGNKYSPEPDPFNAPFTTSGGTRTVTKTSSTGKVTVETLPPFMKGTRCYGNILFSGRINILKNKFEVFSKTIFVYPEYQ